MKTINNTDLSIKDVGKEVTLFGWVQKKRDLGGLTFIDLRDRSGIIQLVLKEGNEVASSLKTEAVIKAVGKVSERESKNTKIRTGDIEVIVSDLELINNSIDIPFEINGDTTALEDTRLKYRYLDIRRENIKNNLILRNKVTLIVRNYLNSFLQLE